MPYSPILVGSQSFYYWYKSLPLSRTLEIQLSERILKTKSIDGIEFVVDLKGLYRWCEDLKKDKFYLPGDLSYWSQERAEKVFQAGNHTMHIAPLASLIPTEDKLFVESLQYIQEETKLNYFTTHPDGVALDRLHKILSLMPDTIHLSLENMDFRKVNFQTIKEFSSILDSYSNVTMTFDVCHWIELCYSENDILLQKFLKKYSSQIKKVHYSTPISEWNLFKDHIEIETNHFPVVHSGNEIDLSFAKNLSSDTRWILEGIIPPNEISVLDAEIAFLGYKLDLEDACSREASKRFLA